MTIVKNMPELMDEFEKWQKEFHKQNSKPKVDVIEDLSKENDEKCAE